MEVLDTCGVSHLISKIADTVNSINPVSMRNTTHNELVRLRDNGNLIPGTFYRITDYMTTTTQENTQSVGHQFDVIVLALNSSRLSEKSWAAYHDGDEYFKESNLSAWQIWYCLDNDTNRFAWADATNGKGVIYKMIDEFGNDCPYDFKNIMFVRYELETPETVDSAPWLTQMSANIQAQFTAEQMAYIWAGVDNNMEKYWGSSQLFSLPTGKTKLFFTFSNVIEDIVYDLSMIPQCHDNIIEKWVDDVEKLSNNVFFNSGSDSCYSNSFGTNCYSNSFGDRCYSNSFGTSCSNNSFGTNCYSNSFGDSCYSNSFGTSCDFNSFGDSCYSNSFGTNCYFNSFGTNCNNNSFGTNCSKNSFGTNCYSNSFGTSCDNNSFGTSCYSNSFGTNCDNNSFGTSCYSNSFGTTCSFNSFGNYCYLINFGLSKSDLKSYYRYIIFDNGNRYINLNCTATTSSYNYFQNVRIGLGVNNTTTYKTINIDTVNAAHEIKVANNSNGELKVYCEADLIA